ncbi:hypothetical protein ACFOYU_11755 [Microvirga sp. GCM10011540]|uniref:hypothetical protein n=1 Tax=Microvirga sp. GCM10011540 TaxID=3317338 RepID=UPI0036232AB8
MLDFHRIGMALGYRHSVEAVRDVFSARLDNANAEIGRANAVIADLRGRLAAQDAGRRAQLAVLRAALPAGHELLQPTGCVYADGQPEVAYEQAYHEAHDQVAGQYGIPSSVRARTPAEWRAEQAEREVLAEGVQASRFLWWGRYHWKGQDYRTRTGAERARLDAAQAARQAALATAA